MFRFSNAFIIVLGFIIPSVIMQSAFMLSVVALLGKPIKCLKFNRQLGLSYNSFYNTNVCDSALS
jgi:hypothetical protein